MNTNLQMIFFVIMILILLIIIFWIFKTENRLKKFFLGKKGKDLENTIEEIEKELKNLKNEKEQMLNQINIMQKKIKKSVQGLEIVRFNPFPDQGSNQSFAISFLNEEKDGVIISSLYGRDRMSVFAKPIKAGSSSFELTKEEKISLDKANANLN